MTRVLNSDIFDAEQHSLLGFFRQQCLGLLTVWRLHFVFVVYLFFIRNNNLFSNAV